MPSDLDAAGSERAAPTATYRLQFSGEFSFSDATVLVPYLAALGVSHLYCSPILTATEGSAHGYDVVDPTEINPEIGGAAGFRRLVTACHKAGLGLVVDIVPNHMSIAAPQFANTAWWSVLREGPDSPYAGWFDVDWDTADNPGQVLVPILGRALVDCLADGELTLSKRDDLGGDWVIGYYGHVLPVAAGTEDPDDLIGTLDRQYYRLCDWRVGLAELNYRRFFDITTLAGLRQEDGDVFAATHRTILEQIHAGAVDGLRIDHPDGLADPEGYLDALAAASGGVWTVVEKILEAGEELPESWACDGTTGYEALNRLLRLYVDPASTRALTTLNAEVTGFPADFAELAREAKLDVLEEVLRPELEALVTLALREARTRRADLTRAGLREAVVEVLAAFDVYRAYVRPGGVPGLDARAAVVRACEAARRLCPHRLREVDLVEDLALSGPTSFVTRFQQTTGPVMAKGIEDTAFYRYPRLLAANEVGGAPGDLPAFPIGHPRGAVEQFHEANVNVQRSLPLTMTTLSTHDTKRSEDVRARLVLISEDPRGWADLVRKLITFGDRYADAEFGWPDRITVYLLAQTLFGAWPISAERVQEYMLKAVREAKLHTSWVDPDTAYEGALANYIDAVLDDRDFVGALESYVSGCVELGRQNSLSQKLLQLVSPGIPDVYQGQELWDASLVDPDNRRPVNFTERARMLAELGQDADSRRAPALDDSGGAKLLVVARALRLRREHPEWFDQRGTYRPLWASGSAAGHVVAFVRSESVIAVAPRLVLGLRRGGGWRDTTLPLPEGRWTDILTGRRHDGGTAYVLRLLRDFPVCLLVRV